MSKKNPLESVAFAVQQRNNELPDRKAAKKQSW